MTTDIKKLGVTDPRIQELTPAVPTVLSEPVPPQVPADEVRVNDADAGSLLRKVDGDLGGALNRIASRFIKTIALPDHVYTSIFGVQDRGKRVAIVERHIRAGQINPQEVLHA